MTVTRRTVLKTSAAALAAGSMGIASTSVWSQATTNLGSVKIDVLSDGKLILPTSFVIPDAPEEELVALLGKYKLPTNSGA